MALGAVGRMLVEEVGMLVGILEVFLR